MMRAAVLFYVRMIADRVGNGYTEEDMISLYFVEFILFSFIGWIYECLFCMIKEHHWENRGFLFGPVCPIYGVGAVSTLILFGTGSMPLWGVFLVCAGGSIVLEYGTSYLLEKRFHALWWDYSDMPLNINGRICLPATLGFGITGVLIRHFVAPLSERVHAMMPPFAAEIAALILMGIFAADLALTVESLKQLTAKIIQIEEEFNERMQAAYETAATAPQAAKTLAAEYAARLPRLQKRTIRSIKRFSRRFTPPSRAQLAEMIRQGAAGIRTQGIQLASKVLPGERKTEEEKKSGEETAEESGKVV